MRILCWLALVIACQPGFSSKPSSVSWQWNYSAPGVIAKGTLTTVPTPDSDGFYRVISIAGTRNNQRISSLYPEGKSIPGNEPYLLDNRIRQGAGLPFTKAGIGFSLSNGNYVSLYSLEKNTTEVFSAPPFREGAKNFGPEDSERVIQFTASRQP